MINLLPAEVYQGWPRVFGASMCVSEAFWGDIGGESGPNRRRPRAVLKTSEGVDRQGCFRNGK